MIPNCNEQCVPGMKVEGGGGGDRGFCFHGEGPEMAPNSAQRNGEIGATRPISQIFPEVSAAPRFAHKL